MPRTVALRDVHTHANESRWTLTAGVFLALGYGCHQTARTVTESPASRQVDVHAKNAATVMQRPRMGTPTALIAHRVTGSTNGGSAVDSGTTIEVLQADGDNFRGVVVLRITVVINDNLMSDSRAQGCYRYVFKNSVHRTPEAMPRCPDTAPLPPPTITPPPPPPDGG